MRIDTFAKIHNLLQKEGFRYCPLKEKEDSTSLPPGRDKDCTSFYKHGYYLFTHANVVCVMYNTRCECVRAMNELYVQQAEKYLQKCLPFVLTLFIGSHIAYTVEKKRPYIYTAERNTAVYTENWLDYPLSSPYVSYEIHTLEK